MGELLTLPNIGNVVEAQLNRAGIHTIQQLRDTGAENAWLMIQSFDSSACIHRLLGLEGGIQGIKKAQLSDTRKAELKDFYRAHKL